ncbi:FRAS1-related extracellular matrix protein 2 [Anabrus simplex]|uniref:FRAS1-related extracellular matrix protein 2 n=1 Tax=Anabrus simplex TaxID=316456 RepID=UPI0035A2EDAC
MQFEPQNYFVFEEVGQLQVPVWRTGDLRPSSSVRCYTRQGTALAGIDFIERPNTNSSTIIFNKGYMKEFCNLEIINDNKHEMDKTLTLVLGSPACDSCESAVLGPVNFTTITIMDSNDYPLIGFRKNRVVVNEPRMPISPVFVWIPVIRQGDLSQSAVIHVYTKDGSAKSGEDYIGKSAELEFHPNVSEVNFKVEILYSKEREITETFTVHLNTDLKSKVKITENKFTVYIEEESIAMGLTFPAPPVVISLRDYTNISSSQVEIMAGYPLICVTACNPQHPEYEETASLCAEAAIVNTLTEYRWYISSSPDGFRGMRPITNQVFFASSRRLVLDSVFFSAGNTVQCGVRAVNSEGISGIQLMSKPIIISKVLGMCKPPSAAAIGAEPFSAKLRITGADDPNYPNMVKMSVEMQHRDGMFPAISTRPLADLELAISPHGVRVGTHKCSNLLNYDEVKTKNHTYNKNNKDMTIFEFAEPELFQFSPLLRSPSTVGFYQNLNLQLCEWRFEYYYSLSELISDCGATVSPDYSRNSLVKSSLEVELPLYISYISLARGLQHTDLSTKLRLVFTYDTTVMWQQGIGSSKNTQGGGWLYPKSMKINTDGQLVVHFQTEAKFNGLFVLSHLKSSAVSGVTSRKNKDLKCTLHLIKSSPTFAHPLQDWTFISNYAVQDYSGVFDVSLIPCEVEEGVSYSHLAPCRPQPPVTFELEVRFQQVSDPVPVEYSLDTQFYLSKQKDLWFIDSLDDFKDDWDTAYKKGDKIYGRLMIKPVQNLKDSFLLSIEKCFLCDGVDGYIPNFNPEKEEYGCIAPSPNLLHNFKIIDATSPSSCDESYDHISFKAKLLKDDEELSEKENIDKSGSDGFSFSPDPLFQISPGKQWFIHCIYTINSRHATGKQVKKRSIVDGPDNPSHHIVSPIHKDHVTKEYMGVGKNGKGTNLHHIELQYTPETSRYEYTPQYTPKRNVWFWWLAVIISTILVTLSVVVVICGCVVLNGKTRTDEAAGIVMCATVQCQKKEHTSTEERTDV